MEETKHLYAVVVRSEVKPKSNYLEYRNELRYDFYYSCAYCSITETEAKGIGFEIDHYLPQKYFPQERNNYKNLIWSCQQCNVRKSDFYPKDNQEKKEIFVLRPDIDNPQDHFLLLDNEIYLRSKTKTGEFNIELLDLNRHTLRRLREIRKRIWNSQNYLAHGVFELARIGIDNLPINQRKKFLSIRKEMIAAYKNIQQKAEDFTREIAYSSLLDEDTEKETRLKKRKEYLKELDAISLDYRLPNIPKKSKSKKRKKKKSSKK